MILSLQLIQGTVASPLPHHYLNMTNHDQTDQLSPEDHGVQRQKGPSHAIIRKVSQYDMGVHVR